MPIKSSKRQYGPKAATKVKRAMHEMKEGKLKSGKSGNPSRAGTRLSQLVSRRRAKGEAKFLPGAVNHNQMLPAPIDQSLSARTRLNSRQSLGRPLVPKANIKRPGTHENGTRTAQAVTGPDRKS